MGFGFMPGFIEFFQLVTTSKDYVLTALHTSQITVGHAKSSQSVTVFTSRCLVAGSNRGSSPYSKFPNYPCALATSFPQELNPCGYLIHSATKVKVKVTLRLTVSQSVCLGVEPRLGLMTRCFFLFESYCPVHVGRPL
jgi:hypothetical protein